MKRLRFILIVLAVFLAGAVVINAVRRPEPSYQGRTLSQWMSDVAPHFSNGMATPKPAEVRQAAEIAVKAIGSNAVPTLVR